jgi:putative Holliday junction resolvase
MADALMALDVGEKRIGIALGDSSMRIAIAYDTIDVDGTELTQIAKLIVAESVDVLVVGYPRNQSGEPTDQTAYAEAFAAKLTDMGPKIVFQDESLTSVQAEQQLKSYGKPYTKGDIDMHAAAIILQDYMEQQYR